jgi:hypothetical protein
VKSLRDAASDSQAWQCALYAVGQSARSAGVSKGVACVDSLFRRQLAPLIGARIAHLTILTRETHRPPAIAPCLPLAAVSAGRTKLASSS